MAKDIGRPTNSRLVAHRGQMAGKRLSPDTHMMQGSVPRGSSIMQKAQKTRGGGSMDPFSHKYDVPRSSGVSGKGQK